MTLSIREALDRVIKSGFKRLDLTKDELHALMSIDINVEQFPTLSLKPLTWRGIPIKIMEGD